MGVKGMPLKAYVDSLPTCGRAAKLAGALHRLQHDAQALVLDRAEWPFRSVTLPGKQGTAFRRRSLLPAGARRARSGAWVRVAQGTSVARASVRPQSGRFFALSVVLDRVNSALGPMHPLIKSGDCEGGDLRP
jgi:hypothetical protein